MNPLKQKQFWKATAINLILAILLTITTTAYFTAIKYSATKLETTQLLQLNITTPEQLLQHEQEILQTPTTIKQIYKEWTIETILFYLLITLQYTALYPSALTILLNNKLQTIAQFKNTLKQNLTIFAIIFLILATITLTLKINLVAPTLQITFPLFSIIILLISSAQATSKNSLMQNINRAITAIPQFIKKSIFGMIIFATITALIFNVSIWMQIMQLTAIIPLIAIIFATWLSSKTLEAMT